MANPICAVAATLGISLAAPVIAQELPEQNPRYIYAVKFLCGPSEEAFQEGAVRGVHATAINLFNPMPRDHVRIVKRVSRALPFQTPGAVSPQVEDVIGPQEAIAVECDEIRMMLPASMTTQFRDGFVSFVADGELVVTAVYSARPHRGEVSTIDIETIEAQVIAPPLLEPEPDPRPQPDPDPEQADLVIRSIQGINVRCTQGRCVTTARMFLTNIGTADAGPFETTVTLDPSQSVVVTIPQPGGLAAGQTVAVPVQSPPGGNCFDPNCQVCAEVDSAMAVDESNETNNTLCAEEFG